MNAFDIENKRREKKLSQARHMTANIRKSTTDESVVKNFNGSLEFRDNILSSVFISNRLDRVGDIVKGDAIKSLVHSLNGSETIIPMLMNHKGEAIGHWQDFSVVEGLNGEIYGVAKGVLYLELFEAQDVVTRIRLGKQYSTSWSGIVSYEEIIEDGRVINVINEFKDIMEISLTADPANFETSLILENMEIDTTTNKTKGLETDNITQGEQTNSPESLVPTTEESGSNIANIKEDVNADELHQQVENQNEGEQTPDVKLPESNPVSVLEESIQSIIEENKSMFAEKQTLLSEIEKLKSMLVEKENQISSLTSSVTSLGKTINLYKGLPADAQPVVTKAMAMGISEKSEDKKPLRGTFRF